MKLSEFVEGINRSRPSTLEIKTSLGLQTESEAVEHLKQMTLVGHDSALENEVVSVCELLEKTNISKVNIGLIVFLSECEIYNDEINEFAYFNDFLFFGQDSAGRIVVYSHEDNSEDVFSPIVSDFLLILIEYCKFDRDIVFRREFSKLDLKTRLNSLIGVGNSRAYLRDLFYDLDE